jgi:nucleotide-binding universal stress UspA family protein
MSVRVFDGSAPPRTRENSATRVSLVGGDQPLRLHPHEIRTALVLHDGTRGAEALGWWWATCFGGSIATLAAPAPNTWCTGLNADWVERIQEVGADLLVLATDRDVRGGLRDPAGLSDYLLEQLDLPVLTCGADSAFPQQVRTILVPIDGTREGLNALPLVLALARALRAEVAFLQVVEPLPVWLDNLGDWDPELRAFGRALDELEQLKVAFQTWGVSSKASVRAGAVMASVASVAKQIDADLLAMSTRARTGTARSIHGSSASAIARMVPQPILWVHRS